MIASTSRVAVSRNAQLSLTNCTGVLISWAMPDASRPTDSSFCAWRSSDSTAPRRAISPCSWAFAVRRPWVLCATRCSRSRLVRSSSSSASVSSLTVSRSRACSARSWVSIALNAWPSRSSSSAGRAATSQKSVEPPTTRCATAPIARSRRTSERAIHAATSVPSNTAITPISAAEVITSRWMRERCCREISMTSAPRGPSGVITGATTASRPGVR